MISAVYPRLPLKSVAFLIWKAPFALFSGKKLARDAGRTGGLDDPLNSQGW